MSLNGAALEQSGGTSSQILHTLVSNVIAQTHAGGGLVVDVGCGTGQLWQSIHTYFDRYVGIDGREYDDVGGPRPLVVADLNAGIPIADGCAAAAVAVETIEHLENPWQFVRELARVVMPGGFIIITTPNQLSTLSKSTLVVKHRFNAFQDHAYPAHRTALLEIDLRRMVVDSGLHAAAVHYTHQGRIPGTAAHYPTWLARRFPRALSDNLLLLARKP